jgi:hypothetical protein
VILIGDRYLAELAGPRLLSKLPALRGIVNQKIRNLSDDQAACRSAGHLDVPKEREKEKKEEKLKMLAQVGAPVKSHGRQLAGVGRRLHPD